MNELQVFAFEDYAVRVIQRDGETWWVASDVCRAIGLRNTGQALSKLKDGQKRKDVIQTTGGPQRMSVVNKEGFGVLLSRSNKPAAFQLARRLGFEVHYAYKEACTISIIKDALAHLDPVEQFKCGPYRIDLYLPCGVAIECDEHGHADRDERYEEERQRYIAEKLGCFFFRFNPDDPNFRLGQFINDVLMVTTPYPCELLEEFNDLFRSYPALNERSHHDFAPTP